MLIEYLVFITNNLICFLVKIPRRPFCSFCKIQADCINFWFNLKNQCGTCWLNTLKNRMFNNWKAFRQICIQPELIMLLTYCFRRRSPWPARLKELWLLWTFVGPLAVPGPLWIIRGVWRYCSRSQFVSFTLHIVEASWINHKQGKKLTSSDTYFDGSWGRM